MSSQSESGNIINSSSVILSATIAISFAKEWLESIGEKNAKVSTEECKFCHSESVAEDIEIEIMTNGYFIVKMEGCPK